MRPGTIQRKKSQARAIAPGATLGQFRVVRVVSSRPGIDAIVEAKTASGTRVGLTVLGDAFSADPALRNATLKLARTRAALEHPHLLPMRGPWQSSGRAFYASVGPGRETLAERLRAGPLEPADAVRIVGQVAGALELAAAGGLVHHELTPSAIVLQNGDAKLGDFGITSPFGRGCELFARSGCIDYRSPEELRGEPARLRSSVYSLTCILVECLTRAPPYHHERPLLTLHAHLVEPAPRISERANGLPARIDAVIATGMAKDPRERFRSPAQLVEAAGKALGVESHVPVEEVVRKQRAREKVAAREERRREERRHRRPARSETRKPASGRARTGHSPATSTKVRRRPSRVAVWAGAALFVSAMSGFATGSADWSGGDSAPEPRRGPAVDATAAERSAAQTERRAYVRKVNRTIDRLGQRRAEARKRLRRAEAAAGQAAAARALAGAYRKAGRALPDEPPESFSDGRLRAGLSDADHAYRRLASAAREHDGKAWRDAARAAVRSEARVERALGALQSS
jgi:hypothetical protein